MQTKELGRILRRLCCGNIRGTWQGLATIDVTEKCIWLHWSLDPAYLSSVWQTWNQNSDYNNSIMSLSSGCLLHRYRQTTSQSMFMCDLRRALTPLHDNTDCGFLRDAGIFSQFTLCCTPQCIYILSTTCRIAFSLLVDSISIRVEANKHARLATIWYCIVTA
jgi:hypothetical protein